MYPIPNPPYNPTYVLTLTLSAGCVVGQVVVVAPRLPTPPKHQTLKKIC